MNGALHQPHSLHHLRGTPLEGQRPILEAAATSAPTSPQEAVVAGFPPVPTTPGIASATVSESAIDLPHSLIVHETMTVQIGLDEIATSLLLIAL